MTAVDVDTTLETDVLAGLDFDPLLPCEYEKHAQMHEPDDPAAWFVHAKCPHCGDEARYYLCDSGRRQFLMAELAYCEKCREVCPFRDAMMAIVPLAEVRGR